MSDQTIREQVTAYLLSFAEREHHLCVLAEQRAAETLALFQASRKETALLRVLADHAPDGDDLVADAIVARRIEQETEQQEWYQEMGEAWMAVRSFLRSREGAGIMNVETLAMELHEAGREAVAQAATLNPNPHPGFIEWADLPENAREGRRIQARFLLSRWNLTWREDVRP